MNLHSIVSPYVSAVNPPLLCSLRASTGYTTGPDRTRVPSYAAPVQIECQIQALQYLDLVQLNGLNIQGRRQAAYITGDYASVVRASSQGGDLITLPDGTIWLCCLVLERWSMSSGWVKVAITEQNNS